MMQKCKTHKEIRDRKINRESKRYLIFCSLVLLGKVIGRSEEEDGCRDGDWVEKSLVLFKLEQEERKKELQCIAIAQNKQRLQRLVFYSLLC